MLGLGTAGRGGPVGVLATGPELTPPLVPLLPAGGPRPRWRLRCAGAAALPGPSVLQPQIQVPVGPGGWGGILEG